MAADVSKPAELVEMLEKYLGPKIGRPMATVVIVLAAVAFIMLCLGIIGGGVFAGWRLFHPPVQMAAPSKRPVPKVDPGVSEAPKAQASSATAAASLSPEAPSSVKPLHASTLNGSQLEQHRPGTPPILGARGGFGPFGNKGGNGAPGDPNGAGGGAGGAKLYPDGSFEIGGGGGGSAGARGGRGGGPYSGEGGGTPPEQAPQRPPVQVSGTGNAVTFGPNSPAIGTLNIGVHEQNAIYQHGMKVGTVANVELRGNTIHFSEIRFTETADTSKPITFQKFNILCDTPSVVSDAAFFMDVVPNVSCKIIAGG